MPDQRPMRWIYFCLAWFFVGLGMLGVFLPVLPTTPFLIIALWAFSKSSERFEKWLYHHRIFGPPLQRWREYRVIPLPAKILATSAMALSWLYLCFLTDASWWVLTVVAALMAVGLGYILPKPSRPPAETLHAGYR